MTFDGIIQAAGIRHFSGLWRKYYNLATIRPVPTFFCRGRIQRTDRCHVHKPNPVVALIEFSILAE